MKSQELVNLLGKYSKGSLSAEEKFALFNYLKVDGHLAEIKSFMEKDWDEAIVADTLDSLKSEEIFNAIIGRKEPVKPLMNYSWISWAAILLLCGITATYYFTSTKVSKEPTVNLVQYTQELHKRVVLPDGSTVILNNDSKLEYTANFKAKREVFLVGEGYFDVKHDAKRPFVVHSGKLTTTVLGTAFNIKALAADDKVVVTVTRGKVSVQNDKAQLLGVLTPSQQIVFRKDANKALLTKVAVKPVVQWQSNDIFLEDVTMEDAAAFLSKKFNVKISFSSNDGKNCRFTATFLKGEGLDEILQAITSFNNATYTSKDGEMIISGKPCDN